MENWKQKYLKYKKKYLDLKETIGGAGGVKPRLWDINLNKITRPEIIFCIKFHILYYIWQIINNLELVEQKKIWIIHKAFQRLINIHIDISRDGVIYLYTEPPRGRRITPHISFIGGKNSTKSGYKWHYTYNSGFHYNPNDYQQIKAHINSTNDTNKKIIFHGMLQLIYCFSDTFNNVIAQAVQFYQEINDRTRNLIEDNAYISLNNKINESIITIGSIKTCPINDNFKEIIKEFIDTELLLISDIDFDVDIQDNFIANIEGKKKIALEEARSKAAAARSKAAADEAAARSKAAEDEAAADEAAADEAAADEATDEADEWENANIRKLIDEVNKNKQELNAADF